MAQSEISLELTPTLRAQYEAIMQLDWSRADSLSNISKINNQDNALVYLFDNYRIVTHTIISDRKAIFNQFEDKKQTFLRKIKKADKSSPYYRYARAEILLQWSILNYKYGNKLEAFTDVWTAYDLLEDNIKHHPDFISSYRSIGLLHAFLGTLPISESMKWLLQRTSGMSGSIEEGLAEIKTVLTYYEENPDYIFGEECMALYAYLISNLKNDPASAWQIISQLNKETLKSPLGIFAKANLALKTGQLQHCIEIIDQSKESHFAAMPYNCMIKARAEMFLQKSSCQETFTQFLNLHFGETYRYATYQKLAWSYLLDGDEKSYRLWMDQCLPKIELRVGEDKDAHKEAQKTIMPDRILLQARMLFDSDQFDEGLSLLMDHENLKQNSITKLEYHYRLGRIYQGLNEAELAIEWLEKAYLLGEENDALHACNAALQIGLVYEELVQHEEAKVWFERCLTLRPDAYRKSLHHKAKSGLKRIQHK